MPLQKPARMSTAATVAAVRRVAGFGEAAPAAAILNAGTDFQRPDAPLSMRARKSLKTKKNADVEVRAVT
jgi:hypothetical protein